jgi:arginyl-tRNA synthetase
VNFDLSATKLPALKRSLEGRLQAAIRLHGPTSQTLASAALEVFPESITLLRANDTNRILYLCPMGLKLAKIWQMSAMDIATKITAHLLQIAPVNAGRLDFTAQAVPPGWIHLQLTNAGLANWLQCLTQGIGSFPLKEYLLERGGEGPVQQPASVILSKPGIGIAGEKREQEANMSPDNFKSLFLIQYAHARCCSLLRLAHREGMITLSDPHPELCSPFWHLLAPSPIPWLNAEAFPSPAVRLVHPAEWGLISQLVDTLDALSLPPADQRLTEWLKLATALSAAFESFYSACRLWGEVKTETPQLAQARLGLILATQSVLRLLLQDLFGVCAPMEL